MTDVTPFSTALRERSRSAHSGSEHAGFMADLMRGNGTRDDYIALVAQHWFIYAALEAAATRLHDDPIAAPFITSKLTRLPAIEADLAYLIGDDWRDRIEAVPTTQRYVERINEIAESGWAGGFVAHHYTRYLGDLSGGQFIGKIMSRQFELGSNGIGFYVFDEIADPTAFKEVYREQLDAAPWDGLEAERVIDEVLMAYQFNTDLFVDLADAKAAAA